MMAVVVVVLVMMALVIENKVEKEHDEVGIWRETTRCANQNEIWRMRKEKQKDFERAKKKNNYEWISKEVMIEADNKKKIIIVINKSKNKL